MYAKKHVIDVESLLLEIRPLLISSIRKYAMDKGDFEDLYQDGALFVLEKAKDFDPSYGVTIHAFLKPALRYYYLSKNRDQSFHTTFVDLDSALEERRDILVDSTICLEASYFKKEQLEELRHAMGLLSVDQVRLLNDLYWKDLTLRQAAKGYGVSHTTIRRRQDAILEKLREIMRVNS